MKPHCVRIVSWSRPLMAGLICLLIVLGAGCTTRLERRAADTPSLIRYQPTNVYAAPSLNGIVRVAALPLRMEDHDRQTVENVSAIFAGELRRTGRFDVIAIDAEELRREIGSGTLRVHQSFPGNLLANLRTRHHVDAILLTEITHYRPYRPIAIGVRSRLFSVEDLQIIWECDEFFEAGDPSVAAAARAHAQQNSRMEFPLESSFSVLQSPSRFSKYVAGSLYETLPPRREMLPQVERAQPRPRPRPVYLTPVPVELEPRPVEPAGGGPRYLTPVF